MTSDGTMDEVGDDTATRDGDFYCHLPNGEDDGDGDPTSRRLREHDMCSSRTHAHVDDQIIVHATPSQYLPMQDDSNEDQKLPQLFMMPDGDDGGGDDDSLSRRLHLREQNDDDMNIDMGNNSAGADVDVQHAAPSQFLPTNDESNNDYYVPLSSPQLPQSVRKTAINSPHENSDQQPIDNTTQIQQQPHYMEMEMEYNDDNDINTNNIDPSFQQHAMELNVALEALESMRRANLAVEFSLAAASFRLRHDKCTFCQREALHKFLADKPKKDVVKSGSGSVKNGSSSSTLKLDGSRLRRFHSSVGSYFYSSKTAPGSDAQEGNKSALTATRSYHAPSASQSNSSLSTMDGGGGVTKSTSGSSTTNSTSMLKKVYPPCLICGHPTCTTHSSSAMSKRSVTICQSCAYLYELDYLFRTIASAASSSSSNPLAECQQKVNDMIDCYDRAKLLLEYASEYAEEIAVALESNTARSNKIGVGSSASGIVSGITGVIGCGALFFPPVAVAGVPLLIASLVFGTGATTVSTGDAAVRQYFSEPIRLADKMFALHGMVLSLLRITDVLRNGLSSSSDGPLLTVSCSRDMNEINDEKKEERKSPQSASVGKDAVDNNGVTPSVASTEFAVAGSTKSSSSSVVGRSTRYLGRVCTTASSSISFIPIVGGVLSGASIYFEGKELKRTLAKISEGNPCAKAERIRSIKDQLGVLPDSKTIAAECRSLLEQAHRYDSGREYQSLAR
ncbi:hypothetical protein ACHAXH_004833 [Discostella pseudostelligera]